MKLHVADDFALPADAVTRTFGVLGMRGSGKSNAAVVMAEEMYRAKLHWVAIDPKGDWFGIRSSADGKAPGLPVVVFGGRHGDVPLEPAAGPLIADLIIDQTMTAILDLSEFTEGEKIRFLAGVGGQDGFAARFYRRKAPEQPPTHLFLEEADDYLPQKAMRDKAKLLHDCSRLFLWGRQRGVGGTLVTQRSARIHKDVLTQSETLIVFRTAAPQDQKAVLDWVKYHGQSEEIIASLSGLHSGVGWVWSPEWLGVMRRVTFRRRETFDSGTTPTTGGKARPPATLADVDLGAIREKMAATIEKAKADDPRELRKRVADLEKQLRDRPAERVEVEKIVEVPVLKNGQLDRTEKAIERGEAALATVTAELAELRRLVAPAFAPRAAPARHEGRRFVPQMPAAPVKARPAVGDTPALGNSGKRWMLVALAQTPDGLTARKLSILTGISKKGGTWRTYLGELRSAGWVEGGPALLRITGAGRDALGDYTPLPTGAALIDYWRGQLGDSGKRRIFDVLADAYPRAVPQADVAAAVGMDTGGGTWRTYLGELRGLELVEGRGELKASDDLFG